VDPAKWRVSSGDSYEARLTELLVASMPTESKVNMALPERELSKRW
jgi:hypothetical protein